MNPIYLLVLLLPLTLAAQDETTVSTSSTFGRYNNCTSGRGACGITIDPSNNGKHAAAIYSKTMSEQSFILTINRTALVAEDEIRIAGKRFSEIQPDEQLQFVQEETLLVSGISLQNLRLDRSANKIYPGIYPMFLSKDKVEIFFTLRN